MFELGYTNEYGGESNGAVRYLGSPYGLVAYCTVYLEKEAWLDLMTINLVGTAAFPYT